MKTYSLSVLLACIINNLVRVFLEVTIVTFSTMNLASDVAPYLHRSNASALQVMNQLPNVLILSIIGLGIIDWHFNCRQWLGRELSLTYQKAVLPSELPHIILKMLFLTSLNIQFFGISGMISGMGILLFCLVDRIKPIDQILFLIFEVHNSLTIFAKLFKVGFGVLICTAFTTPILWLGVEWFTQRKLPIEQLVIFASFNIFILLSLFRIIKVDRTASV
jgi:hypothetical protein